MSTWSIPHEVMHVLLHSMSTYLNTPCLKYGCYMWISLVDSGVENMYGRITALDPANGKEQVVEKLYLSVVVMTIKPLLIHQ